MKARIIDVDDARTVKAAGGLVCRPGPAGLTEVAVVHRPAYDDWSFPKGKLERGETPEAAAVREVAEETGLECNLLEPFGCTQYVDRRGAAKTVCYWIMEPTGGRFKPGVEVDELRWLTASEALDLLSYARDREVLKRLAAS
ncbi:MAG: NUDIX hydrolase [Candidatus Dormibacteraeota bacterium]|nr:NUDIX hydrolase [Candidatus Dormibacteraeota bacterium]